MERRTDYRKVTKVEEVMRYIGDAGEIAFDFETAPDDPYREEERAALDPARSHIVTMSISVREHTGIMLPVAHRTGTNVSRDEFENFLRSLLTDPRFIKVAHNLSFESMFAYARGIVIREPVYDTIAASQMSLKGASGFRTLGESGLKTLASELCGEPLPAFTSVTGGRHFDELDPEDPETVRYSCADADFALRLRHIFNGWFDRYLPRHRWIVEHVESPTAVYLGIMKYNGVPVDEGLITERRAETEERMEHIRKKTAFLIGDVNIGSNGNTNAFKKYLYEELGLPVMKLTGSNKAAMDDSTLIMLREWCDANRPELSALFTLMQEYRKWGKIRSTYIDGYLKYRNPVTGRLHPDFFALSTDTGRFSCTHPNCQNMPRKTNDPVGVRNFIRAPEGHVLISCDYSQIELRIGAYYCRDEIMLDTYRHGGDIHAATTAVIFGIPYEQAADKNAEGYKERRTIAKNVNFGTFYGLYPKGLQKTLRFKAGIDKDEHECEEIIRNLKASYPRLVEWQDRTKAAAARCMYTETCFGRRRYLPDIRSADWGKRSFAERCSMNTPIQGTAADIIKAACADKDDTIGILMEQAKDLESEKKALMHEKAELEEEKEVLRTELKEARSRVSELEMKIKNIRAAYKERENGNQASIKESLDAVSAGITRILLEIEKLGKARNRRGIFGIFGDESSENREVEKPAMPGDDFVRSILTDPELNPDQYKLLIYCVEEGLPVGDIRAIADTKVDIERMEFLARWYFRKNKITYKYGGNYQETAVKEPDGGKTMEFAAKEENA